MRSILTILLIVCAMPADARELVKKDNFSLSLKGYYKNLLFTSKTVSGNERYLADINRLRTEWDAKAFKILSAKVIWDNELIAGNYVQTPEFATRDNTLNTPYLDMAYKIGQRQDLFYGQTFYRAYLTLDPGPFKFTAGRQTINWGVARILSAETLFTAPSTFSVETDYIVATDAANLTIPIGEKFRVNAVYTIQPQFNHSRTGLRLTHTFGRFDVSVLGGRFLQDWITGCDFTGDIHNVGVRGEFIYDLAHSSGNFAQLTAGVDYGFKNSFTIIAEYFFNGQAANQYQPLVAYPTANFIQSQYAHLLSISGKYDITPLLTASLTNIWDIQGLSTFLHPDLKYSVLQWMDLDIAAIFPVGKSTGEFSFIPNLYSAYISLFF